MFPCVLVCIKDPQECLHVMRQLLRQLPNENYATLKYLMAFLVLVTLEEEVNKMSAMALAIVFGPAMFRYVLDCITWHGCMLVKLIFIVVGPQITVCTISHIYVTDLTKWPKHSIRWTGSIDKSSVLQPIEPSVYFLLNTSPMNLRYPPLLVEMEIKSGLVITEGVTLLMEADVKLWAISGFHVLVVG